MINIHKCYVSLYNWAASIHYFIMIRIQSMSLNNHLWYILHAYIIKNNLSLIEMVMKDMFRNVKRIVISMVYLKEKSKRNAKFIFWEFWIHEMKIFHSNIFETYIRSWCAIIKFQWLFLLFLNGVFCLISNGSIFFYSK